MFNPYKEWLNIKFLIIERPANYFFPRVLLFQKVNLLLKNAPQVFEHCIARPPMARNSRTGVYFANRSFVGKTNGRIVISVKISEGG